jgi:purine-binding chemotaxis protein CheW
MTPAGAIPAATRARGAPLPPAGATPPATRARGAPVTPVDRRLCTFQAGEAWFGMEVARVQEVVRALPATPVPLAPPVVAGLVNLRGQLVTAIDLRRRLELAPRPDGQAATSVVVRTREGAVSLLVDEIGGVLETDPGALEPPPETLTGAARSLITGAYQLADRLLLVLDVDAATAVEP